MFALPVMLFIITIMSIVQISVWQMFPPKLRDIMMSNPIFAFLINLAGSGLIAMFTGIASIVGLCNLGASVVFGVYAAWYSKKNGITGLGISWYKLWNYVPIFPRIMVLYKLNGKEWMA